MGFSLTSIPRLKGYVCEWMEEDNYIFSLRNKLYHSHSITSPLNYIGSIPEPFFKSFFYRFSLIRRLLRKSFYNVLPLKNGVYFVSYGRQLGLIKDKEYIPFTSIDKPFRVLRSAAAVDARGNIFFGEYTSNDDRMPVKIYRYSQDDNKLKIVHEFEAGSIRHIHGIYYDEYSKLLWCLCGDVGNENRILSSSDEFKTISMIGGGDESWRAVSVLFTEKYAYYSMDAEYADNFIIRVDKADCSRKKIGKINGPVYYSYKHDNKLFFAVTAELCPSQSDKYASLYTVDSNDKMERVLDIKKDFFSVKYFLPGAFYFPAGPGVANKMLINTVALRHKNSNSFSLNNNSE